MTPAKVRASRANIKKAHEARALKAKQKQMESLQLQLENLKHTLDDKVDSQLCEYFKKIDRKQLKDDFIKVFYEVGGIQGLKKWVMKDTKNRLDYYKLLVTLLKSASENNESQNRGGIELHIHGLYSDKEQPPTIDIEPSPVQGLISAS